MKLGFQPFKSTKHFDSELTHLPLYSILTSWQETLLLLGNSLLVELPE